MAGLTRTPLRKCRLRFFVFDVKMWRFIDWLRVTLPVPVSLNRFLAPLCDFSFGTILPSPDARSENKHPLPPTQPRSTRARDCHPAARLGPRITACRTPRPARIEGSRGTPESSDQRSAGECSGKSAPSIAIRPRRGQRGGQKPFLVQSESGFGGRPSRCRASDALIHK